MLFKKYKEKIEKRNGKAIEAVVKHNVQWLRLQFALDRLESALDEAEAKEYLDMTVDTPV